MSWARRWKILLRWAVSGIVSSWRRCGTGWPLLGRPVLPSGVTPLTAVATTVRYGEDPRAEVRFGDGHEEKYPLAALGDLVTERGNPRNRLGIAAVTAFVDAPVLAGGVELVDTPGTGSVYQWDTDAAHQALETMDAAVLVLTADPPVSASERDLLGKVGELSVTTFTVLNKADHLDAAGRAMQARSTRCRRGRPWRRGQGRGVGIPGSPSSPPISPPTWHRGGVPTWPRRQPRTRGGSPGRCWMR